MRHSGIGLAIAMTLTACGGGAEPAARQSPSVTPSPTPTLPTVGEDKKLAKQALVTAAGLGKPWIEPKRVNTSKGTKGDFCPGQQNASTLHKPRATASRDMTEGSKAGAAIASFGVRTYGFGEEQQWRDAVAKSQRGCASWTAADGTYVVMKSVAPPTIAGADEVLLHIERIYADKTKKQLYYVRHYYEARTGRVVSSFQLAYVQPASDPTGGDLTRSAPLMEKQVAKTKATFGV